jgi:Flp pilus assembly protein protease CpaA
VWAVYDRPRSAGFDVKTGTRLRWIPLALVLVAVGFDLFRQREIPDVVPVLIFLWAVIAAVAGWKTHDWISQAAGCALGLGIGLVLFQFGGFGGGDVKLIASLGAVFGFATELSLLFYVAIAGAILALIAKFRGKNEFAYAPAIAIGVFVVTLHGAR